MQMNWLGNLALTTLIVGCAPTSAAPPDMDDVPLTLAGCVRAGEARDSYLLTNVVIDGPSAAPARAFYRFNTTKGLKDYVGRRVEVKGKADLADPDKGKVRVRTEDGKATTEVTSERRTVKVGEALFGSIGATKLDADVVTYRFDVDSVTLLNGNCTDSGAAR